MRILIINHEFPPVGGGAATASAQIARELALLGHEVTVLTSAFAGRAEHEQGHGYALVCIPALRRHADKSNPWEMLSFLLSSLIWALVSGRKKGYEVCIAFFGLPGAPAALLLKWLTGTPYIVSLRGGDVPGFLPQELKAWHTLTGSLIRFLWKRAAAVVANSGGLASLARKSFGGGKVAVIPNGIDARGFARPSRVGNSGPLCLLFTGRLNVQKNLPCLLEALANLSPEGWSMTLVGDGPERRNLEALTSRLGLGDKVTFAGWRSREDLPDVLGAADVYVFPSLQEGMPNSVLEAMAAGLPVIACPVEGCEELITHGETGLLVPVNDASALAGALRTLLDDPALRQQLGHAGRERVREAYTWRQTATAYEARCFAALSACPARRRTI